MDPTKPKPPSRPTTELTRGDRACRRHYLWGQMQTFCSEETQCASAVYSPEPAEGPAGREA